MQENLMAHAKERLKANNETFERNEERTYYQNQLAQLFKIIPVDRIQLAEKIKRIMAQISIIENTISYCIGYYDGIASRKK